MISLEGKTALITGGSRGIGRACVEYFHECGCKVGFTYKLSAKTSNEIEMELSGTKSFQCDIEDEKSIKDTIDSFIKFFGKIDILVNNAGIWEKGPIEELSTDDWNKTINTNLTSIFLFSKYASLQMKKSSFGRIINISSTAGQRGESNYSHYATSKGGIISFTKSLAAELGPFGINTNAVAPGWVITDMVEDVFNDEIYLKQEEDKIPTKKISTAEDIAGAVLFLASNLANNVNGEIINVNGGSVLCG